MTDNDRHVDLESFYLGFNERDADAMLLRLAPDVEWPNGWEGGYLTDHGEIRAYWERQWSEVDWFVSPAAFATLRDGRVAVSVDQLIKDLSGSVIQSGWVVHIYTFGDYDLITHMEVREIEES